MTMNRVKAVAAVGAAAVAVLSMTAHADWTVVRLHPVGATSSWALGMDASQRVGHATAGGIHRASLWSGSAPSWGDMNDDGVVDGQDIQLFVERLLRS